MKQAPLLDGGPKQRAACLTCGGRITARRCRPCQKDTPAPSGPAWRRWVRGIDRVVRARLDGAGLGRWWAATWEALLFDGVIPAETAPLVEDIVRLPFSHRRWRRYVDRALLRSQIETMLTRAGYPNGVKGRWVADNIAAVAAERIQAQRDRVAGGDAFERVHDAELVHEAVLEHEAREQLRADGWRGGPRLEAEVRRLVELAMRDVRGMWDRAPEPRAVRIEVARLRVASPADDDDAVIEAAEAEAAVEPRRGRAA